jgi:hypothetical protein
MKIKTTIFFVISMFLLGTNAHASWFSQWRPVCQKLMHSYACPAWQRTQQHMLNNRWKYLGLATAGIGAGCWYYSRVSQHSQVQHSPVTSTPQLPPVESNRTTTTSLSNTNEQERKEHHEIESDHKRFYSSYEPYKNIIDFYRTNGWELDERPITDTWPKEQIAYLRQHQVPKEMQHKLDDIMLNKELLKVLSTVYTHVEMGGHPARQKSIDDPKITDLLDKTIIGNLGLTFLSWGAFTLKQFPHHIFKMALPELPRFSEKANVNRVYHGHTIAEYVAKKQKYLKTTQLKKMQDGMDTSAMRENALINDYRNHFQLQPFQLIIPHQEFYIVPKVPWIPYVLSPKVIVVTQKLDLTGIDQTSKAKLPVWGSIAHKILTACGHTDIEPHNVICKESPRSVIIVDTKQVKLRATDVNNPAYQSPTVPDAYVHDISKDSYLNQNNKQYNNKTFSEQYETCITPHGLVAHSIPLLGDSLPSQETDEN